MFNVQNNDKMMCVCVSNNGRKRSNQESVFLCMVVTIMTTMMMKNVFGQGVQIEQSLEKVLLLQMMMMKMIMV